VNAIHSHLASPGNLNQKQIQLLQRIRHSRQEAVCFPAFDGRGLRFRALTAMVHVQQEGSKQDIEFCQREPRLSRAPGSRGSVHEVYDFQKAEIR